MNPVYQLILKIQKCPALYIGSGGIYELKALLDGYAMRDRELCSETAEYDFLTAFQGYIQTYYQEPRTLSWASILQEYTQDRALDEFFARFDEFVALHPEFCSTNQ